MKKALVWLLHSVTSVHSAYVIIRLTLNFSSILILFLYLQFLHGIKFVFESGVISKRTIFFEGQEIEKNIKNN